MKGKILLGLLAAAAAGGAYAFHEGLITSEMLQQAVAHSAAAKQADPVHVAPPQVTVAEVKPAEFVETVLVTGSLVPREEILVAPEVEGLKVLTLEVDEGDRVKKGDILATLVAESLDAQIAQSDAAIARADAGIARAKSQIVEAEARLTEAKAALERARPLVKSDYLSQSAFDQRKMAADTAEAQLTAAKEGHRFAEAEKGQALAQRRELDWRRGNTEVRAPADGIVSRRAARVGSIAVGAFVAGGGEPLFRIISKGEIELEGDVPESRLVKIAVGQTARVEAAGGLIADGTVRLVSPEVDKGTRLGRVRIFLGDNPALKIGAFARGTIETARTRGLAVPQSAVLFGNDGPVVLAVADGRVKARRIEVGLQSNGLLEVSSGLAEGDVVVAKAGTFLRDGDAVTPIAAGAAVSEAR